MNNINQIVTTFLAAGGLGYINYWILEKLDLTSSSSGEKAVHTTFSSLLCSIPDFFIYLFIKWGLQITLKKYFNLSNDVINFIALFIAMSVIFLITVYFGKKIITSIYWILRKITTGNGKTGVEPSEPWTAIDKTGKNLVYLYNLNHEPIAYGYGEDYSGSSDSNYSINLQPAQENSEQLSYENVVHNAYFSDGSPIKGVLCEESHIYVNLKQGFIMVIFKTKKSTKVK